jgi:hypothetical protein
MTYGLLSSPGGNFTLIVGPLLSGVAVVTSLNPGPPSNSDARVIVIVAPSNPASHTRGGVHIAPIRTSSVTGSSNTRSSIQPSCVMVAPISSFDTRSPLRSIGGEITIANSPGGGSPQQVPSSQTSEPLQSALDRHSGSGGSGTLRHAGTAATRASSARQSVTETPDS